MDTLSVFAAADPPATVPFRFAADALHCRGVPRPLEAGSNGSVEESVVTESIGVGGNDIVSRGGGRRRRSGDRGERGSGALPGSEGESPVGLLYASAFNDSTGCDVKRYKVVDPKKENGGSKPDISGDHSVPVNELSQPSETLMKDFIHVRARRGQATDSHSLAERARREKISQRMKILQDLVPGCNKVIGKALVLDEIINYILSLHCQVEFLSMKLEVVHSRIDFNEDCLANNFGSHRYDGSSGLEFDSHPARESSSIMDFGSRPIREYDRPQPTGRSG